MGFIDYVLGRDATSRARRLVGRLRGDPTATPDGLVEAVPVRQRADVLAAAAELLAQAGDPTQSQALLDRALELAPDHFDGWAQRAKLAADAGDTGRAILAYERLLVLDPGNIQASCNLSGHYVDAERAEDAVALLEPLSPENDPMLAFYYGVALAGTARVDDALRVLRDVRDHYELELKNALDREAWQLYRDRTAEAVALIDELVAERHGRESVVLEAASRGGLDARAGVNYRLLGESLMPASRRRAISLHLRTPQADLDDARARLKAGEDADALVLFGSALLREGRASAARDAFERAAALDGTHFGAFLGIGAALDGDRNRRLAAMLPDVPPDTDANAVVPDLPMLTALERRVVACSVNPLRAALPLLAARAVSIRILPLDARSTDLPELAHLVGERGEDHRVSEAVGGLATESIAVAKIEELLDVESPSGWTFAHELAHLVFMHLPDEHREPILELYERAVELGHVCDAYQLSNEDEFFVAAYTDFLRVRHGRTLHKVPDETGLFDQLLAWFESFERLERLRTAA